MEKFHEELLITNRVKLIKNIDVTKDLYSELLQRKVLTQMIVREIKTNKNTYRQIEELLDILPRRGPHAFDLFCECLIATGQETIVHSILKVNLAEAPTEKPASSGKVSTAHS
ncbi:hypothetical protein C0Q70_04102 [Pomacea canaliculata]|uniref:CARD domain-containing protein n=1 Tax=Pomacea canaliculata TaxID=400727 RepID=A0A2T7PUM2_POMCA|nr:caspase-2-like [Pomacea canaliculata]PVD37108.1 hypothetical protein C0Q70_04102 [Pomacea canaliculata]